MDLFRREESGWSRSEEELGTFIFCVDYLFIKGTNTCAYFFLNFDFP